MNHLCRLVGVGAHLGAGNSFYPSLHCTLPIMDCNICTEAFDEGERLPKVVIPCAHSVCLKCLQQLTDKKCPTCRQVFQGPPGKFPNNFALLQLLGDVKLRSDKPRPRGWCFKCGAAASPKCWAEHDVLAVGAALKRRLEGVLPRAARQLQGLQDQVQEEQAAQALTLLGGQSWGLTLRGGSRVFSGTLNSLGGLGVFEDPVTQALLLALAAKAGLTEITRTEGKFVVDCKRDLSNSAKAKDRADNLELICGVERLPNVYCSAKALEVLQAAAPTVEHLSLSAVTPAALRETCAMPRLTRLQVTTCCRDFVQNDYADSNAVPLPKLPSGQGRLQWLDVRCPRRSLLELLLPAHRLTLEVLQLDSSSDSCQMACSKLYAMLKLCDLRALRRLVLINMLPNMYTTYRDHRLKQRDLCSRQRSVLLRVLPVGAEVLCWLCDGGKGAPLREVF